MKSSITALSSKKAFPTAIAALEESTASGKEVDGGGWGGGGGGG